MPRAMWKAALELGSLRIPVKLYAAVEERGIQFRLLHRKDRVPVSQQLVDPRDGEEVPAEAVRRGLEVDEGVLVVLSPDELAAAEPKASRVIEVTRFVPRDAIDPSWYSRPYFLGPDGEEADYFALAKALEKEERHGIARWVMRGQRYFGALEPREGRLALVALHAASEVVDADSLAPPAGAAVSAGERRLAEQLVEALDAEFDPAELRDEYRERVEKLIDAKRRGRRFEVEEPPAPRATRDLSGTLRRSLQAAKTKGRGRAAA